MASIYQVDQNELIAKVAEGLKKSTLVQPPEWAKFVKTGVSKQRAPIDSDWWHVRAASVLRAVYKLGPIGVAKLRTKYGSKKNRGYKPEKFKVASGNILRTVLQQLEKEGYVAQNKDNRKKGRVITAKGQSLLEKTATQILGPKSPSKPKSTETKPKADTKKKESAEVEQ